MDANYPGFGNLRRSLLARPEVTAVVVILLSWVVVLAWSAATHVVQKPSTATVMPNMPPMASMPGMAMSDQNVSLGSTILVGLLPWLVMTTAMMGPAALAGLRYTGLHSLVWRRQRAMAEFAAGYLILWCVFGVLVLSMVNVYPAISGWIAFAAVLAVAAVWQVTPMRRRLLQACHRARPLPPRGWRAECGAFQFGLRHGLPCIGTCCCLMVAMILAPSNPVIWMIVFSGLIVCERRAKRPRRAARLAALGLTAATLGSIAIATVARW